MTSVFKTPSTLQAATCTLALGLILVAAPGCGTVRTEADFQHTAGLIEKHTGIDEVYDPAAESAAKKKVAQLLDNGLTTDEALRVALLNNRGFQARFFEIGASRADVVQSGLLSNPVLSFSVRLPQGGGRSNLGMGLAQEIVDLWQIPVRKKIAAEQLEQVVLGVVQYAVELRAEVQTRCWELMALQKSEAVAKEKLDLAERSFQIAQRQYRAGESRIVNVNLAQTDLLDVKTGMARVRRDIAQARAALSHTLGLAGSNMQWRLVGKLPEDPAEIGDDASLVYRAAEERIDVQISASEVASARQEIRSQKKAVLRNVALGLEGERTEMRAPKTLPYNPLGNLPVAQVDPQELGREFVRDYLVDRMNAKRERDLEKRQSIDFLLGPSAEVTLPVWDQNRAQIAKARFNAQKKQKDCEELLESVVAEVKQAAAAVRAASESARLLGEKSLPLAKRNVETARRSYEAGEESIFAVLEARKSLIQQRDAYIRAVKDQAVALAHLERAIGGPLPRPPLAQPAKPRPHKELPSARNTRNE